MSKTAFAAQLGVSKGYISQLMNADFDHKISKLIELSLAIGKAPILEFVDLNVAVRYDGVDRKVSKLIQQEPLNMVVEEENMYEKRTSLKSKTSLKKAPKHA